MQKKKSPLLPIVGTIALLAGGSAAGYWVYTQQSSGPGGLPVGATVLPQDVLMTMTLSTDDGQWKTLRSFGTPKTQAAFDQVLANAQATLLTNNGYNYETDIKPWVGDEVTIAFLAPSQPSATPSPSPGANLQANPPTEQTPVVVLPIGKPLKAEQILKNIKPVKQGTWTNRVYQGVDIRETEGSTTQNYSVSVLDNKFIVITTNAKASNQVIDAYKSGKSIAETPGYAKALSQIKADGSFGQVYVNIPIAARLAASGAGNASQALQQNQGLAATISLEDEGIRFRGVSWLRQDSEQKHAVENKAKLMPTRLPADTLVMASGFNVNQLWDQYTRTAGTQQVPFQPKQVLDSFKSATGMDLDKDFFSWMRGEFSLALLPPTPGSAKTSFPAGFVMMVDASDRKAADQALTKLDQVMADRYKLTVKEDKIANQAVVNWTVPLVGNIVTRGWLDGNVAFLNLGAPTSESFAPKPSATLAASAVFQKAVPTQPDPSSGRFFLNVESTYATLNSPSLPLSRILPFDEDSVKAIKTIGLTTSIANDRTVLYELLVQLSKGNPPGPLPAAKASPLPSSAPTSPESPTP